MMRDFKTYNLIALVLIIISGIQPICYSQDIHFSQMLTAPTFINPALTGFFKGTERISLNHRSQWASISIPYSTFAAAFDMNYKPKTKSKSLYGFGTVLSRDKAGDSEFGSTGIMFNASYIQSLNTMNTKFISFGLTAGLGYRSIDFTKLQFDLQFDGYTFNPNLSQGETFTKTNFYYPDIGGGIHWSNYYNFNLNFNFGGSLSHINNPNVSLMGDKDIRLYRKLILYHYTNFIIIQNKLSAIPLILYSKQRKHHEMLIGSSAKCQFKKASFYKKPYAIIVGAYTRFNDALILMAGVETSNLTIQFSYDVNYSKLRNASILKGGPEISLVYILSDNNTKKQAKIMCPIF